MPEKAQLLAECRHIRDLLRGHRCRVDDRSSAGGPVCNLCQAGFAIDGIIKDLEGESNE